MADATKRRFVAVSAMPDGKRDLKVTSSVINKSVNLPVPADHPTDAPKPTAFSLLIHGSAAVVPTQEHIDHPEDSTVDIELADRLKHQAARLGVVPDRITGTIKTAKPFQPVVLGSMHERTLQGITAVNDPHADSVHIVTEGTLLPGAPATVIYTGHDGSKEIDIQIDPKSLPDHSNAALAAAAGLEAIKAATDNKGRAVTTEESPLHQFAVAQGYKVEPLGKPVGDATHVVKKPSSAGDDKPKPTPTAIVEQALAEMSKTSPPNAMLVSPQKLAGHLTLTMVPRPADRDDTTVPVGTVEVHHTEKSKDGPASAVARRLHAVTGKDHRVTGRVPKTGKADSSSDDSGSSSSSSDDDDDKPRRSGKMAAGSSSDDDDDDSDKKKKKKRSHKH
jgi:hypothetical protein